MHIVKASKKPMVQGAEKQKDLKNIIFSPNGNFVISIDRTFGVKLWNAVEQTLISEFTRVKAHYATFTPDSRKLILVGRSQISIYQLENLSEIKRFENGHAMGTADCSPDNLHLAYSNSSQLWVLDLVNFERLYHVVQKSGVERNSTQTQAENCFPFFVKFNQKTNELFTSSLNTGQLCKWELPNSNSNKVNSSQQIQVKESRKLQSIVSDIDFSDDYLLISSDRNRRRLFIMNPEDFEKVGTRIMPKSFFLDFNTEVHSTYSQINDIIISMTVPGDFLFLHNGTDLNFIKSENISINTYAIAYDENRNILGLGGQVANRQTGQIEDQVLFYKIVKDCSLVQNTKSWLKIQKGEERIQLQLDSICQCVDGFSWHSKSQKCTQLDCLLDPKKPNSCLCQDPKEKWNSVSSKCEMNCLAIENSFNSSPISMPQRCPCKDRFRWDSEKRECREINCRKIQGSVGRLNVPFSIHACACNERFRFDSDSFLCVLDCGEIENTTGQPSVFVEDRDQALTRQACFCLDGFVWSQQSYSCLERFVEPKIPQVPPPQPKPQPNHKPDPEPDYNPIPPIPDYDPQPKQQLSESFPILAILIPIFLILSLCLIGIILFCWYKRCKIKKKSKESSEADFRIENTDENKDSNIINPKVDNQRKRRQKRNRGKTAIDEIKDVISQNIDDQISVPEKDLQRVENYLQNTKQDNNKTRKYRRRKIDRLDKTAKISMDELSSDRPIILKKFETSQKERKSQQSHRKAREQPKKEPKVCEICLESEADALTTCNHYFHYICIEKSILEGGNECPACWSVLHSGIKEVRLLYDQEDFVLEEEEFQSDQFAENLN